MHPKARRNLRGDARQRGATLVEIMVATLIMGIIAIGMVEFFARGRLGFDQEERKRAAVLLAQEALERTVAQDYDDIDPWTESRNVEATAYAIAVTTEEHAPDQDIKTIRCTVTWNVTSTDVRTATLATYVYNN